MKPLNLKRPNLESPNKILRRKASEDSIPPSFRLDEQKQQKKKEEEPKNAGSNRISQLKDLKKKLKQCTDLTLDDDGDNYDQIPSDEVLNEMKPKMTTEKVLSNKAKNKKEVKLAK